MSGERKYLYALIAAMSIVLIELTASLRIINLRILRATESLRLIRTFTGFSVPQNCCKSCKTELQTGKTKLQAFFFLLPFFAAGSCVLPLNPYAQESRVSFSVFFCEDYMLYMFP